jgi:phosphoglycerate dehydrogenase-like enzyme
MNSSIKYTLGVIYNKSQNLWQKDNLNTFLNLMKSYENITVKLIEETEYNKDLLPTDLDFLTTMFKDPAIFEEVINLNKNLKWIHVLSAGVDKIAPKIPKHIPVTNTQGVFCNKLAEYVMFAMLYYSYSAAVFEQGYKDTKWVSPVSHKLIGKTVGIIGFGGNGIAIAKKAKFGFGMKVIGIKNNIDSVKGKEFVDEIYTMKDLDNVLACSDFVVSTLPQTKDTIDLFTY